MYYSYLASLHMSFPWGVDLSYMLIAEIHQKKFFPMFVQDSWNLCCRRLLSGMMTMDDEFQIRNILKGINPM